jgi:hypothetical protein
MSKITINWRMISVAWGAIHSAMKGTSRDVRRNPCLFWPCFGPSNGIRIYFLRTNKRLDTECGGQPFQLNLYNIINLLHKETIIYLSSVFLDPLRSAAGKLSLSSVVLSESCSIVRCPGSDPLLPIANDRLSPATADRMCANHGARRSLASTSNRVRRRWKYQ